MKTTPARKRGCPPSEAIEDHPVPRAKDSGPLSSFFGYPQQSSSDVVSPISQESASGVDSRALSSFPLLEGPSAVLSGQTLSKLAAFRYRSSTPKDQCEVFQDDFRVPETPCRVMKGEVALKEVSPHVRAAKRRKTREELNATHKAEEQTGGFLTVERALRIHDLDDPQDTEDFIGCDDVDDEDFATLLPPSHQEMQTVIGEHRLHGDGVENITARDLYSSSSSGPNAFTDEGVEFTFLVPPKLVVPNTTRRESYDGQVCSHEDFSICDDEMVAMTENVAELDEAYNHAQSRVPFPRTPGSDFSGAKSLALRSRDHVKDQYCCSKVNSHTNHITTMHKISSKISHSHNLPHTNVITSTYPQQNTGFGCHASNVEDPNFEDDFYGSFDAKEAAKLDHELELELELSRRPLHMPEELLDRALSPKLQWNAPTQYTPSQAFSNQARNFRSVPIDDGSSPGLGHNSFNVPPNPLLFSAQAYPLAPPTSPVTRLSSYISSANQPSSPFLSAFSIHDPPTKETSPCIQANSFKHTTAQNDESDVRTHVDQENEKIITNVAPWQIAFSSNGIPLPFIRPPFPIPVPDRSSILSFSPAPLLRTCFRIGEAISATTTASHTNTDIVIELYARIDLSTRQGVKQNFVFADLFAPEHGPYLRGSSEIWKGVEVWDNDAKGLVGNEGRGKMVRVVGKMEREREKAHVWWMRVLSVMEVGWEDVEWVKGIICA